MRKDIPEFVCVPEIVHLKRFQLISQKTQSPHLTSSFFLCTENNVANYFLLIIVLQGIRRSGKSTLLINHESKPIWKWMRK